MYTAEKTITNIKRAIEERGYSQKKVYSACNINENTVSRMNDSKGISSFYLAKIADYLNCSVDYLLGRQVSTPELSENESILLSFFRECSENSQKILLDLAEHYSRQDASAKEKEKISV